MFRCVSVSEIWTVLHKLWVVNCPSYYLLVFHARYLQVKFEYTSILKLYTLATDYNWKYCSALLSFILFTNINNSNRSIHVTVSSSYRWNSQTLPTFAVVNVFFFFNSFTSVSVVFFTALTHRTSSSSQIFICSYTYFSSLNNINNETRAQNTFLLCHEQ